MRRRKYSQADKAYRQLMIASLSLHGWRPMRADGPWGWTHGVGTSVGGTTLRVVTCREGAVRDTQYSDYLVEASPNWPNLSNLARINAHLALRG